MTDYSKYVREYFGSETAAKVSGLPWYWDGSNEIVLKQDVGGPYATYKTVTLVLNDDGTVTWKDKR